MTPVVLPSNVRNFSLVEELEQAMECLRVALERMNQGHVILRFDAPTLLLLTNGLERYLKVALQVLHHETGDFTDRKAMKSGYGHQIVKLGEAVLQREAASARENAMSKEDLRFVQSDPLLNALLTCLDAYADQARYFLLDGVSGYPVDPEQSPGELWENVLACTVDDPSKFADADARSMVSKRLISTLQQYLRCITQAVHGTAENSRWLSGAMTTFLLLRDDQLSTPIER